MTDPLTSAEQTNGEGLAPEDFLVNREWLHAHRADSDVRIFDCTTHLHPSVDDVYRVEAAEADYLSGHIPDAGFLNLPRDLSADNALRFMTPAAEEFALAAGAAGVRTTDHVILYSTGHVMWATRVWWLFRTFGHPRVSVLDGGLGMWKAAGLPVEKTANVYPPAQYRADTIAGRVATAAEVLAAIDDDSVCIVNALSREKHAGTEAGYGRDGRIPGSNVLPALELTDDDGCFLPPAQLIAGLEGAGVNSCTKTIAYCGGGIAATVILFAQALTGDEAKGQLYDGSMSEWANRPDLPMERDGAEP
jgi:thiosulfate/3-mercaptopyruvate sulfurtransferase